MTRVVGVLPTFRRQQQLALTLDHIAAQTRPLDELIVVDNENSKDTREIVASVAAKVPFPVHYEAMQENVGSAGGWAYGMQLASSRAGDEGWLATLDDDNPYLFPNLLEQMVAFAEEQRLLVPKLAAVGVVGARFNWQTGSLVRIADEELTGPVMVDYLGNGHGAMYRADVWRTTGGFARQLFFGHTEVEYGLRLRRAGYTVLAHGKLWYVQRQRTGRLGLSVAPSVAHPPWRSYYVTRNYIYMMVTFGRWDLAWKRALREVLARPMITAGRSPYRACVAAYWGCRAAWDGFRGNMGRTVEPVDQNGHLTTTP